MLTQTDEQELLRLTRRLELMNKQFSDDPDCTEAVQKAALALSITFIHGLRAEVEQLYDSLDTPLPNRAREHLRQLGLDPDADEER